MNFKEVIVTPDIVIHCSKLEDAKILLNAAHKKGLKWQTGEYYNVSIEKIFSYFCENTCFDLYEGQFSSMNMYHENKKIIEFDTIEFNDDNHDDFDVISSSMTFLQLLKTFEREDKK